MNIHSLAIFYIIPFYDSRHAKRKLDDYSFFGNVLHVSYAPEWESVAETREKLQQRRKAIAIRTRKSEPSKTKNPESLDIDKDETTTAALSESTNEHGDNCQQKIDEVTEHQSVTDQPRNNEEYFQHQPHPSEQFPTHAPHGNGWENHWRSHMLPPPNLPWSLGDHSRVPFCPRVPPFYPRGSLRPPPWPCREQYPSLPAPPRHGVAPPRSYKQDIDHARVPSSHSTLPKDFQPYNDSENKINQQTETAQTNNTEGVKEDNVRDLQQKQPRQLKENEKLVDGLIIRDVKTKSAGLKFVPRQAVKHKHSDSEGKKKDKETDNVNIELRRNAFVLGAKAGPLALSNSEIKAEKVCQESVHKTRQAIRDKVKSVFVDTIVQPPRKKKK
ncbi:unnamed protein product [Owenia fusiformis]|uniref:Uncharacterized protein n=1 Tax=Owenia fusiformis TaxID=6347 RepID=A0A8J1Y3D2_OWEFU|nr:unnamed protein product [Owenia fusiformis]